MESFCILRRQNFEDATREGLVEAKHAINACNPLLSSDREHVCRVYPVNAARNNAARFATNYSMIHHIGLVELDNNFTALRDILDINIGWGSSPPIS